MALGTYVPTYWVNGTAPGINATNLNHIELGIESVTSTAQSLEEVITNLIPSGIITMFSGSVVPVGWALCDGTQGTPDLVGRFILGGNGGDTGQTGGSADAIVVDHTHTFSETTSSDGSHTHELGVANSGIEYKWR